MKLAHDIYNDLKKRRAEQGRELDLTRHRSDLWSLLDALQREIDKRDAKLRCIEAILKGETDSVYNSKTHRLRSIPKQSQ